MCEGGCLCLRRRGHQSLLYSFSPCHSYCHISTVCVCVCVCVCGVCVCVQAARAALEGEVSDLRNRLADKNKDYHALMNENITLEAEIERYRYAHTYISVCAPA